MPRAPPVYNLHIVGIVDYKMRASRNEIESIKSMAMKRDWSDRVWRVSPSDSFMLYFSNSVEKLIIGGSFI